MIKASTAYALVTNEGEVIARGSSANMRKLARVQGGRVWLTSTPIGGNVIHPSGKLASGYQG